MKMTWVNFSVLIVDNDELQVAFDEHCNDSSVISRKNAEMKLKTDVLSKDKANLSIEDEDLMKVA